MASHAIAEEKRTITVVADDDTDVPDALRFIARELERSNGVLVGGVDLVVGRLDGTEQLPEPELDENGEEKAPPPSSGMTPRRLDITISAEIRTELFA